ncbi:MAG: hypothetical protein QXX95_06395 [Nitrososphaerales archaeon]
MSILYLLDGMNWKEIDAKYVRQGELLLDLEFVKSWRREVSKMNYGKEGSFLRWGFLLFYTAAR